MRQGGPDRHPLHALQTDGFGGGHSLYRHTEPWVGCQRRCPERPAGASVRAVMPIGPKTRTCAILGHPVGHSLSPAMHNAAFEALGLDFAYVAHDVAPEQLPAAVAGIRALGYRGLSITIPHKVAALSLVDRLDRVAAGIGCINTIVNDDGVLSGYNSDGLGALLALRRAEADPAGKNVVVVGSGGAARAITMTIVLEAPPRKLTILGIVPAELEQLAKDLRQRTDVDVEVVTGLLNSEILGQVLPQANLLLQTTPVGMAPQTDLSPVPANLLHPDLVVFDAVYTPRRTKLLADALAAGARVVEGLEMFLGQALTQFELFTGHAPPEAVMRRVVERKLGR
jgi:shikimate dehydrogenase